MRGCGQLVSRGCRVAGWRRSPGLPVFDAGGRVAAGWQCKSVAKDALAFSARVGGAMVWAMSDPNSGKAESEQKLPSEGTAADASDAASPAAGAAPPTAVTSASDVAGASQPTAPGVSQDEMDDELWADDGGVVPGVASDRTDTDIDAAAADAAVAEVTAADTATDAAVAEVAAADTATDAAVAEVAAADAATDAAVAEVAQADAAVADVTELVEAAPSAGAAAEVTEVVAAVETPGAAEPTAVLAADSPAASAGGAEVPATYVDNSAAGAAEPTAVYPSSPAAGGAEVPATSVEDSAGGAAGAVGAAGALGAAGAAAAGGAAAPGWVAAPPPPYPAAPPPPPAAYQTAPPPAYAAAPAAGAGGYGTVTQYQPGPQTSNKAVVAMVMAILSFVVCPVILAIAALIVGGQAKQEIGASNGWLTGEGLVTGAKILAWVNIALTAVAVIFGIIFFLALGATLNDLEVNVNPSSGLGT